MKTLKELKWLYIFSFFVAISIITLKYFNRLPTSVDTASILNLSSWVFEKILIGIIYIPVILMILAGIIFVAILFGKSIKDSGMIIEHLKSRDKIKKEKLRSDQ